MRLAIISDVHGNLEALEQVLADIDGAGVERVVCLGDNIGYGPDPEAVVQEIRRREIPCVMGNHELGLADPSYLNWFNPTARKSLLMTQEMLSPESRRYSAQLPPALVLEGCRFVHGYPPDSITTYLFEVSAAGVQATFQEMAEQVAFIGHTHILEIISSDGRVLAHAPLGPGRVTFRPDLRHIINVGSVGQPRDGDNRAKYVIWDTAGPTLEVRFVAYDIAATAEKIMVRGLPEINARRLW